MIKLLITFSIIFSVELYAFPGNIGTDLITDINKIIHGDDNRYEPTEYFDPDVQILSRSVALMASKHQLYNYDEKNFIFNARSLKSKMRLCDGEKFENQPTLGHCTAFLIAPNLVATAAHCISQNRSPEEGELEGECSRMKFVFDFTDDHLKTYAQKKFVVNKEKVVGCKKIISFRYKKTKFYLDDHAIVQLDRDVNDRMPLKLNLKSRARIFTSVFTIGHPNGLPLKIADEGSIKPFSREKGQNYFSSLFRKRYVFYTNLDTFRGNSGSPVFNSETKLVEGILIGGDEDDYIFDEELWCRKVNIKDNSYEQSKEQVLRIKMLKPALNAIKKN